jgi:N-methylhydantoinase B/oxoprolinase/acetone carboxylase alpha subunit
MHSTKVTNFTDKNKFATVEVTMDGEGGQHITASISKHGSEVTLFFNSPVEIQEFATALLIQAAEVSLDSIKA